MKAIQFIINAKVAQGKSNLLYALLGKFGDRLPKDVQEEIRKEAEGESRTAIRCENSAKNNI